MKKALSVFFCLSFLFAASVYGWQESIDGSWGATGLTMTSSDASGVQLNLSLGILGIEDFGYNGRAYDEIVTSGILLPADAGSPNFPSYSRAIAVPVGARVRVDVIDYRTRTYYGITPVPAPEIPLDSDDKPLSYIENLEIYGVDKVYPANIVSVSEPFDVRGVDGVYVGVIPFQWNPVSKELTVYTDIRLRVTFEGGRGEFGEERLRSPNWDRILSGFFANFDQLPEVDYSKRVQQKIDGGRNNAEFIIICPDNATFIAWADTICRFRTEQGIISEVFTLTEVGGSTYTAIQTFIDNAYNTWTIPPEAFLILGDYPQVTSPMWNSYCVSDNIYASVASNGGGDSLPDIAHGRICAQNATHLQDMITKDLIYERTPPTSAVFYNQPTSACGFQTERWFQVAAEVCRGFWVNSLGKSAVRVYATYSGSPSPGGSWSSNANTSTVVNYFHNLGYIDLTIPAGINWNATTTDMLNQINGGTWFIQHRDHGSHTGWGEPNFQASHLSQCTNTAGILPFTNSTNCLTGEYDTGDPCFTETFHRAQNKGFLGLNAASETSYSFVNDSYIWGMFDYLWPAFMPDYGSAGDPDIKPGFSQTYGKLFLAQSSWPYNPQNKIHTYHLFHHHGDPYMRLYSNVPQTLSVSHPATILAGATTVNITAPAGSMIALSVDGVLIGRGECKGSDVIITIEPQYPPTHVKLVVTKQDYYIYEADLPVTSSSIAYIVYAYTHSIAGGHSNGQINPGQSYDATLAVANFGSVNATNVRGYLTESDPYITLDPDTVLFGTVNAGDTVIGPSPFGFTIASGVPDGYTIPVTLVCWDSNDSTWTSDFNITANAPIPSIGGYYGQSMILPGDVVPIGVKIYNTGTGTLYDFNLKMRSLDAYASFTDSTQFVASIAPGDSFFQKGIFTMNVSSGCPNPHLLDLVFSGISTGCTLIDTFGVGVGNMVFIEDFEDKDTADWTWTGPASWHISTRDANSPTHSVYCGDEATGVHANGIVNARAVSPEIYVNAGDTLTFWHRYYMFATWDGVQLQMSTDGGTNWAMVTTVEGYTSTNGGSGNGFTQGEPYWSGGQGTPWHIQHLVFNVTGSVRLGWKFGSTTVVAYEGYYFDDINMGVSSGLGVEEENGPVNGPVVQFALMRAYPNPVRGRAVIGYSVGAEVPVRLAVYDISGREVTELVNCVQGPGTYRVEWDGRDERGALVSSGTYFYRIVAGSFSDANKIVVVR